VKDQKEWFPKNTSAVVNILQTLKEFPMHTYPRDAKDADTALAMLKEGNLRYCACVKK